MKALKPKNIKTLQTLTQEYHKTRKLFLEALDKVATENIISLCEKLTELEKSIMENLNAQCSVVSKDSKIVLQLKSGQGIKLEDFTQAEAKDLIKAVEYSIFRNYINGIGA